MPADAILTLAWLVLAHLVADFIVQTGAVVMAKNAPGTRGWLGLFAHGLGVGACLIPVALAFGVPGLWTLLAITVAHMLIDRTKILLTRRRRAAGAGRGRSTARGPGRRPRALAGRGRRCPALYFAADQAAHLAVTLAAWAIWLSGQAPTAEWSTAIGNLFAGRDLAVVHDVDARRRRRRGAADRERPGGRAVRRDARPPDRARRRRSARLRRARPACPDRAGRPGAGSAAAAAPQQPPRSQLGLPDRAARRRSVEEPRRRHRPPRRRSPADDLPSRRRPRSARRSASSSGC